MGSTQRKRIPDVVSQRMYTNLIVLLEKNCLRTGEVVVLLTSLFYCRWYIDVSVPAQVSRYGIIPRYTCSQKPAAVYNHLKVELEPSMSMMFS